MPNLIRKLLASAIALALWQVAPAYAGHNEPVTAPQLPAFTGGDCTTTAGSVAVSCATLKGQSNTWASQKFQGFRVFDTSATADRPAGFETQVNGQLLQFGANFADFGTATAGSPAAVLRLDTRGTPYALYNFYCGTGAAAYSTLCATLDPSTGFRVDSSIAPSSTANDLRLDTTANSQNRLSHVANATALAAWTNYAFPVMRDDVAAVYADTGASCATSGGDGGWQIQPATGHCWQADITKGAPITLWGAPIDDATDLTPYLTKAAAAMNAVGGGEIVIPSTGSSAFAIKTGFQQTFGNVRVRCQPGAVIDRQMSTGNLFQIGNPTAGGAPAQNTGIEGCIFKHSTTATSGADVELSGNRNTYANNLKVLKGAYQAVAVDNGVLTEIANLQESAEGHTAICLGCNGAQAADVTIRGGNINYQHGAAVECVDCSGITFNGGLNTDFNTHGFWCHPGTTSQRCNGIYAIDPFFDTSFQEGVLIDLTNGPGYENNFGPDTWIASCGGSATPPTTNAVTGDSFAAAFTGTATAPCLHVIASPTASSGAGAFVDNQWAGHIFNAGGEGIRLEGGLYNDFSGVSADNCTNMTSGNCAGFHALNAVSHWTWNGRAGGTSGLGRTSGQLYGVAIDGASDYFSIRGDLSGNKTAPLIGGGAALHADYTGMLPAQAYIAYTPTVSSFSGTITSSAASGQYIRRGSTVFFAVSIIITNNGSGAGYVSVSLPLAATTTVPLNIPGREDAQTGKALVGNIATGGTSTMTVTNYDNSYPGGASYKLDLAGSYTVAQ